MKAGREMDALVAEKVMGWEFEPMIGWYKPGMFKENSSNKKAKAGWSPSTSISPAWEVVEKIGEDNKNFVVFDENLPCLHCYSAEEAALEICLAALKAKGVEVG